MSVDFADLDNLGLPSALAIESKGHTVTGHDTGSCAVGYVASKRISLEPRPHSDKAVEVQVACVAFQVHIIRSTHRSCLTAKSRNDCVNASPGGWFGTWKTERVRTYDAHHARHGAGHHSMGPLPLDPDGHRRPYHTVPDLLTRNSHYVNVAANEINQCGKVHDTEGGFFWHYANVAANEVGGTDAVIPGMTALQAPCLSLKARTADSALRSLPEVRLPENMAKAAHAICRTILGWHA